MCQISKFGGEEEGGVHCKLCSQISSSGILTPHLVAYLLDHTGSDMSAGEGGQNVAMGTVTVAGL